MSVEHAPTEVVLTRQSANVSELTYHLRLNGDNVDSSLVAMFDSQLQLALSASFLWDLPDQGRWQATNGVLFGRLGFRAAQTVALPACVASRPSLITPFPCALCIWAPQHGHGCAFTLASTARVTSALNDAVLSLVSILPHNSEALVLQQLMRAWQKRDVLRSSIRQGAEAAPPALRPPRENGCITPEDGDRDPRNPTLSATLALVAHRLRARS